MAVPKFSGGNENAPHRYGKVYDRQEGGDWSRLVIGADGDHVGLLIRLAEVWSSPDYWFEYISLKSLNGQDAGHYLSPTIDEAKMNAFLIEHREFLEGYAGHDLWIGHPESPELLVYDQNNLIFAYGAVDAFAEILEGRGFQPGPIDIPDEHRHGFDPHFSAQEEALFAAFDWEWAESEEDDEEE